MLTALILAAGSSKRMGQPKMILPWGHTTVIGQVIETLKAANIEDILVVTGGARILVEEAIAPYGVRAINNPKFARREMLNSIQFGLRSLSKGGNQPDAVLIALGDQPQMEAQTIRAVVNRFEETHNRLVVPSYQMRRGHPWVLARPLWKEVLGMSPTLSPRDFLHNNRSEIDYVNVDTPSILADLDTYEDYLQSRP
jgi:molybdenum cofactor cytidylyltransferase